MEDPQVTEQMLLDGVNILLESINELPITREEDYNNILEAQMARQKIVEVTRAVLSEGWDFNTDENWKFPLDPSGMIPVPTNVLDITSTREGIIMRNWRLYDKTGQTHIFDEEVACKVIWDMDFNSLSHPLRHYITIRAARVFMARTIGDEKAIKYNEFDEEDARLSARRSETRTGQYNMLTSGYGINNRVRAN